MTFSYCHNTTKNGNFETPVFESHRIMKRVTMWKRFDMGSGPKATTNFQKNGDAASIRSFCDSQKYFFFFMLKTLLMQQILCKGLLPVFLSIFAL